MGISKTEHFSEKQNEMARIAKALGHPARIAILEYLVAVDKCICGDIVNELPLAQPTISQHLRELKNVGLIQGNIEGNSICYCVNPATLAQIMSYFSSIASTLNTKNCC